MTEGTATVVKNAGSHYVLSCLPEWKLFPAVLRGRVRLAQSETTNPIAVGDRVRFSAPDGISEQNPAIIKEILPRSNYLIRRSTNLSKQAHIIAANLDRAIIAVSLYFPQVKLPLLDRILVSCELYGIKPVIVLNKVDLYRSEVPDEMQYFTDCYTRAGYEVLPTSTVTGEGIVRLKEICRDRICLFSGESGVGKSSLIKAIDPALDLKIGKISVANMQGRHTTSLYEMYRISGGGFLIDSPGIRGFGLVDVEKEEIYKYFPEILEISHGCRFTPCTHTHEPGCAVKQALDSGRLCPERYNSYLGMLEEDSKFR